MSRRTNGSERRKLGLRRETLRRLAARDLGRVAGGSWWVTDNCGESDTGAESANCSADCTGATCYSTGSRFC